MTQSPLASSQSKLASQGRSSLSLRNSGGSKRSPKEKDIVPSDFPSSSSSSSSSISSSVPPFVSSLPGGSQGDEYVIETRECCDPSKQVETKRTESGTVMPLTKEGKKKEVFELVERHEAPLYLRQPFILRGYRVDFSFLLCVKSLFRLHNESGNVLTHVVAASYHFFQLLQVLILVFGQYFPSFSPLSLVSSVLPLDLVMGSSEAVRTAADNAADPFFHPHTNSPNLEMALGLSLYYIGCLYCFSASACFHLFNCHSHGICCNLLRADFSGIVILTAASYIPPLYAGFSCHPNVRMLYLVTILCMGIITALLVLSQKFQSREYRPLRIALFVSLALFGGVPILNGLILMGWDITIEVLTGIMLYYFWLVLGFSCYFARMPERFLPGKFDYLFHSHQIWHILIFYATIVHKNNCIRVFQIVHKVSCDMFD